MINPGIGTVPSPELNTVERTAPYEFTVRKLVGSETIAKLIQVRPIEGMELADLTELYGIATTDEHGNLIPAIFVSKSTWNIGRHITIRRQLSRPAHEYTAVKRNGEGIGTMSGSREALPEIHRFFTLDFEEGDSSTSEMYMGCDSDGNPEIWEFSEATPDDFE